MNKTIIKCRKCGIVENILYEGVVLMPNMSYCRFQNTYEDLQECLHAIKEQIPTSTQERGYAMMIFRDTLTLCRDNDIIEGYDKDALNEMLDKCKG